MRCDVHQVHLSWAFCLGASIFPKGQLFEAAVGLTPFSFLSLQAVPLSTGLWQCNHSLLRGTKSRLRNSRLHPSQPLSLPGSMLCIGRPEGLAHGLTPALWLRGPLPHCPGATFMFRLPVSCARLNPSINGLLRRHPGFWYLGPWFWIVLGVLLPGCRIVSPP